MQPPRVVLDTNVVVSAHLNPDGLERLVLNGALALRLRLCVSAAILEEYDEALRRPKFHIHPSHVEEALRMIRARARMVTPGFRLSVTPDPDDNKFLECAEAAGADYRVTGNRRHFPAKWKRTAVVNARGLIGLLAAEFR
jgi:putative PIN family toxin of toxin-antitoxin system